MGKFFSFFLGFLLALVGVLAAALLVTFGGFVSAQHLPDIAEFYRADPISESVPNAGSGQKVNVKVPPYFAFKMKLHLSKGLPEGLAFQPSVKLMMLDMSDISDTVQTVPSAFDPQVSDVEFNNVNRARQHGNTTYFLKIRVCLKSGEGAAFCNNETARVEGYKYFYLSNETLETAGEIDLGDVYITRYIPTMLRQPCLSKGSVLGGKIMPTAEMAQQVKKGAPVAVVGARTNFEWIEQTLGKENLKPDLFTLRNLSQGYQKLAFDPQGMDFKILPRSVPFGLVPLFLVVCGAGEDEDTCASRAVPFPEGSADPARHVYRVVGTQLEVPHCGKENFSGYVHTFGSSGAQLPKELQEASMKANY